MYHHAAFTYIRLYIIEPLLNQDICDGITLLITRPLLRLRRGLLRLSRRHQSRRRLPSRHLLHAAPLAAPHRRAAASSAVRLRLLLRPRTFGALLLLLPVLLATDVGEPRIPVDLAAAHVALLHEGSRHPPC